MPKTRMTNQRRVILEELRKVHTHPTVDELYTIVKARMPHISLGTVYRNLDLLTETGEVLKLDSAGSMRRYDGHVEPHRHVRCRVCGCIGDIFGAEDDEPHVEKLDVPGFTVTAVRVEYDGICDKCKAALATDEQACKAC
ncbi:MAG: transcriptional repressor [Mailhella sp.]|nr:transcriptional repressor [Mailhella sp.]